MDEKDPMKAGEKGQCPGKGEMLLPMCRSKGGRDGVDAGGCGFGMGS